jgi:hypothetical protein
VDSGSTTVVGGATTVVVVVVEVVVVVGVDEKTPNEKLSDEELEAPLVVLMRRAVTT